MNIAGHLGVAGLTLKWTKQRDPKFYWAWALAINLLAHPILEVVPHAKWDTFSPPGQTNLVFASLDILASLLLILRIWSYERKVWVVIGLVLCCEAMDIADYIPLWTLGTGWPALSSFHLWVHILPHPPVTPIDWSRTLTGNTPLGLKLAIQILLVAIPWYSLGKQRR